MSTPRHPNRLKKYASDKKFYPRELVEANGILYLIGDDGDTAKAVKLNEKANCMKNRPYSFVPLHFNSIHFFCNFAAR